MKSWFVTPESPQWSQTLARIPHDYYHLPAYVRFAAGPASPPSVCAFVAEENDCYLFAPLIIRPIDESLSGRGGLQLFDATCLRGDPSLIVGGSRSQLPAGFLNRALAAFVAGLREKRVIACFLWLHPILIPDLEPLQTLGHLTHHKLTVSIDLTLSKSDLWKHTRANHRRGISRAGLDGQTARIDARPESLDTFVEIYQETMERVGASEYWYLSQDYFYGLKDALSERLHLCVIEQKGEVVAAGLFSEVCGIVQYVYGGSRTGALRHGPLKTMISFMTMWAKDRGNHSLHLGGGVRSDDDLFHFKVGFSPRTHPVLSWRLIVDDAAYGRLTTVWQTREKAVPDAVEGFFPAYRKPSPTTPAISVASSSSST